MRAGEGARLRDEYLQGMEKILLFPFFFFRFLFLAFSFPRIFVPAFRTPRTFARFLLESCYVRFARSRSGVRRSRRYLRCIER